MITFSDFLAETYVNLIKDRDDEKRENLKIQLFDMLKKSYQKIGGLHGSGFSSENDMIENIPFWKLVRKNGEILSAVFYKDKDGRKLVATTTNGSQEGKEELIRILIDELGLSKNLLKKNIGARSYFEISGPILSIISREIDYDLIKSVAVSVSDVRKMQTDSAIYDVGIHDPEVMKHPELRDFFYMREIGGENHTKIMLGVKNQKIQ